MGEKSNSRRRGRHYCSVFRPAIAKSNQNIKSSQPISSLANIRTPFFTIPGGGLTLSDNLKGYFPLHEGIANNNNTMHTESRQKQCNSTKHRRVCVCHGSPFTCEYFNINENIKREVGETVHTGKH